MSTKKVLVIGAVLVGGYVLYRWWSCNQFGFAAKERQRAYQPLTSFTSPILGGPSDCRLVLTPEQIKQGIVG
jgi:hypothetical protein